MLRKIWIPALALSISLSVAACGSDGGEGFTAVDVSFGGEVQPIFNSNCSCHLDINGPGGLDLRPGSSWNELVNQFSPQFAGEIRVVPGSIDSSLLWLKVSTNPPPSLGARMPKDRAPLGGVDLSILQVWIEEGALNN